LKLVKLDACGLLLEAWRPGLVNSS